MITDKVKMNFGSFFSQGINYLVLLILIRFMTEEEIAVWSLIDGLLLFLPFGLSFVSERSSLIAFYEKGATIGKKFFKLSNTLTITITLAALLLWVPIQYHLQSQYLTLSILILISGMSTALSNIRLQKYLVLENYSEIFKMHLLRGSGIAITACIFIIFKLKTIYIIPLALMVGNFISIKKIKLGTFNFKSQDLLFILKMSAVPIILIFMAYLLQNTSRLLFTFYSKKNDLIIFLIYAKNATLFSFILMPFTNFLKPLILKNYKIDRQIIPNYWKQLMLFGFFICLGAISSFSFLWRLWGISISYPDHMIFSVLISGTFVSWFFSSIIELYYEHSSHIYKKLIIYSLPLSFFVLTLVIFGSRVNFSNAIIIMFITQFLIFLVSLNLAFSFKVYRKILFSIIVAIASLLFFGYFCQILFLKNNFKIFVNIFYAFSFLVSIVLSLFVQFKNDTIKKLIKEII